MAEGGGLLNRYTVNSRIVGSNPIPSASLPLPNFSASRIQFRCRSATGPTPHHGGISVQKPLQ